MTNDDQHSIHSTESQSNHYSNLEGNHSLTMTSLLIIFSSSSWWQYLCTCEYSNDCQRKCTSENSFSSTSKSTGDYFLLNETVHLFSLPHHDVYQRIFISQKSSPTQLLSLKISVWKRIIKYVLSKTSSKRNCFLSVFSQRIWWRENVRDFIRTRNKRVRNRTRNQSSFFFVFFWKIFQFVEENRSFEYCYLFGLCQCHTWTLFVRQWI